MGKIEFLLVALTALLFIGNVVGHNVTKSCEEAASSFALPPGLDYVVITVLIMLSALFSGLTLGLLGLDKIGLEIVIGGDDPELAACAKAILPVREKGNLLLCTLLLGNVAVNAMLSILMADLTNGLVGFLVSTIVIVIFGEIIPQASCSRHALRIGRVSLPIVKFFMVLLFVVAYPISWVLDKALGQEIGNIYSRTELKKMLEIHVQHGAVDEESGVVMHGALKYRDMKVREVMTPAKDAYMVSVKDKLNYKTLSGIFKGGFSRVPVYDKDRNDVIGLLLAKDLLLIDPEDETPVQNFISLFGRPLQSVWPDQTLGEVLKVFKQGRGHLAIVRDVNNEGEGDPFYELVGIITLEDIIEEILGEDKILDETDAFIDDEHNVRTADASSRDRELARLVMLTGGKMNQDSLSFDEINAISSHLRYNVPQLRDVFDKHISIKVTGKAFFDASKQQANSDQPLTLEPGSPSTDMKRIQLFVSRCKAMDLKRASTSDMVMMQTPASEDVLYKRGKMSQVCTLILSGKVKVLAGKDEFASELGPWSIIGTDALKVPEGSYTPDFTAYVCSESVRCLIITKSKIDEYLSGQDLDQGPATGGSTSSTNPGDFGVGRSKRRNRTTSNDVTHSSSKPSAAAAAAAHVPTSDPASTTLPPVADSAPQHVKTDTKYEPLANVVDTAEIELSERKEEDKLGGASNV